VSKVATSGVCGMFERSCGGSDAQVGRVELLRTYTVAHLAGKCLNWEKYHLTKGVCFCCFGWPPQKKWKTRLKSPNPRERASNMYKNLTRPFLTYFQKTWKNFFMKKTSRLQYSRLSNKVCYVLSTQYTETPSEEHILEHSKSQ
jgi:hypothetical protein